MKMIRFTFFIVFFIGLIGYGQSDKLFQEGNELYNDGQYVEAIERYENILSLGQHSADLYFNLGNAHYKLNNIAPSIYYYEKALRMRPNDREIQNNLAFARNMTIDAIEPLPEVGFSKFLNSFALAISFNSWAKLSVGLIVLFTICFILYYFSRTSNKKRILFFGSLAMLVIFSFSFFMAYYSYNHHLEERPAIVYAVESDVKSEPNLRGAISFTLHEGTKVQILDSIENWSKIRLADGKTGWILQEDIKSL